MLEVNFNLNNYQNQIEPYINDLLEINKIVFEQLKLKDLIVFECSVIDLDQIQEINLEYRKIKKPTDVISFAFWDGQIKTPLLGEMFICYEKIQEQAKIYNHSFKRELCFLYVHGLLHLLGYDHLTKEQEQIMFSLQEEILNSLKIYR